MKKIIFGIMLCGIGLISISAIDSPNTNLTANFISGNTEIASINALSFGPEGIIFIGDSKSASVYALDTKDKEKREMSEAINIKDFDKKIAASLGTTTENIKVTDMAVNPISKTVYFSVNVTDGTPVLLKLVGENLENVSLKNASYSKITLEAPNRKRSERQKRKRTTCMGYLRFKSIIKAK